MFASFVCFFCFMCISMCLRLPSYFFTRIFLVEKEIRMKCIEPSNKTQCSVICWNIHIIKSYYCVLIIWQGTFITTALYFNFYIFHFVFLFIFYFHFEVIICCICCFFLVARLCITINFIEQNSNLQSWTKIWVDCIYNEVIKIKRNSLFVCI